MASGVRCAAMLAVVCVALASTLRAQDSEFSMTPAERQELTGYRLTMDNIRKVVAVRPKMEGLENDPKMKAKMDRLDPTSVEDAIAKVDATPEIHSAVTSSGLTSRDFVLTILQVGYTGAAVRMQGMAGPAAKAAAGLPTSPENIQFYKAHEAELLRLTKEMRMPGDHDDE